MITEHPQTTLDGRVIPDWRSPAEECKRMLRIAAISMMVELRVVPPIPRDVAWYPSRWLYAPARITCCLDDAVVIFDRALVDGFKVASISLIVVWPDMRNPDVKREVHETARTGYFMRTSQWLTWRRFRWWLSLDRRFKTWSFPRPAQRDRDYRAEQLTIGAPS